MKIAQTIRDARADRAELGRLALVPTMGALHEGHLALIREARRHAPHVAVSIFVNPTQFGPREDFHKYPRPIERDLELCQAEKVDLVFNPAAEEMYPPPQFAMRFEWPQLTEPLEGKFRPGHFSGVCQVVTKLFNILTPDVAVFGEKDFQQLRVIRELVRALDFRIELVPVPTVREPDGLAMSSRNAYLSPAERKQALAISRALFTAEADFKRGVRSAARLITTMQRIVLEQHLLVDYVACVDAETLKDVDHIHAPAVLALACRAGKTRLIDNLKLIP
ncbi:MAG: pantoate--beta-alanine ligase [Tepidisphaerales bacterium]